LEYSETRMAEPVDDELERLKRRRLHELQRRMRREEQEAEEEQKPREKTPEEILSGYLVGRAWEVLRAARAQFPQVMPRVEEAIVEAIKAGRVRERIDGESLFQFLRQLGLPVRLQTSIRYKEHGELKTIGQRLKER
jgi:programmed cell death protein 5